MSLNFGNEFAKLAYHLRDNETFQRLRFELGKQANRQMAAAIRSPSSERIESTAYARAVFDLYQIFECSASGTHANQIVSADAPHIEELEPTTVVEPEHPLAKRPAKPGGRTVSALPPLELDTSILP